LSPASAVAVSIVTACSVVTPWRGTALAAALTLGCTTATALAAAPCTAALMSTTPATRSRFAARRSLTLSAFCRGHERSRRDEHCCCDEEWFDAHTRWLSNTVASSADRI
jgi:hypothetical protein